MYGCNSSFTIDQFLTCGVIVVLCHARATVAAPAAGRNFILQVHFYLPPPKGWGWEIINAIHACVLAYLHVSIMFLHKPIYLIH